MKKLLFAVITTVMVSGLLLGGIDSNVFATKDDNNGKAKGCENASTKSKGIEKNPHCDDSELPQNTCDANNNGSITSTELALPLLFITSLENTVDAAGGDTNKDGEINTLDEWNQLQAEKPGMCLP